ncbi:MAG: FGGY family carbohydrate kinase, partial [Dorea sp.]
MDKYYLAIDIGASSGRHILGWIEDGKMNLEEIYRFTNGMEEKGGSLVWDMKHLFSEIVNGMKKCAEVGKVPSTMSIDTWGVDYVLLDENDQILGETYGYRDNRMNDMDTEVYRYVDEVQLYAKTGIQKQMFNTIYQLMADKMRRPEVLEKAKTLLMFPDYFQFRLTGKKVS